jgi:hypothetical protein
MTPPAISREQAAKIVDLYSDPQVRAYITYWIVKATRPALACAFWAGTILGGTVSALITWRILR